MSFHSVCIILIYICRVWCSAELHLTAESCLCDACYRHVDRKANCPSYKEKTKTKSKRLHHMSRAARPKAACCVQGCAQPAQHHVRRKWLTKLKRSIGKKVNVVRRFQQVFHKCFHTTYYIAKISWNLLRNNESSIRLCIIFSTSFCPSVKLHTKLRRP